MSIRKKILLMFGVCLAAILFSIFVNVKMGAERYFTLKSKATETKLAAAKMSLRESGDYLKKFALDYSLWDEMVKFVKQPDTNWAIDNIHSITNSSQITHIWICDSNMNLVYKYSKIRNDELKINFNELKQNKSNFRKKIIKYKYAQFFIKNQSKILEVCGAGIHYSKDYRRKQQPKGFIFFSGAIDDNTLRALGVLTQSKVYLSNKSKNVIISKFETLIKIPLTDCYGRTISNLYYISQDEVAKIEAQYNKIWLIIYVLFLGIVFLGAYISIYYIITIPLKKITKTLDKQNTEPIKQLKNKADEFGKIATLIEESIKDKELIKSQLNEIENQNEILAKLNATKDKFFSIIAHDLRNPFGVILNITDLLSNQEIELSTEEVRDFTKDLHQTSKSLYELLENLLTWARSQRGTIKFEPQNIDVAQFFEETLYILKPQALIKNIDLQFIADENLLVFADKDMFATVIRNLISNAIKFTPNNGKILISAHKFNNELLEISVKDNGVGISPENLAKLFRIDINLTTSGTNDEKGSGLGLILCKDFVEKNGGSIKVVSEQGKGANFIFTIPAKSYL